MSKIRYAKNEDDWNEQDCENSYKPLNGWSIIAIIMFFLFILFLFVTLIPAA